MVNLTSEKIWKNWEQLRSKGPLVLNITNYVVMNSTANALLCAGASPIMAHERKELEDLLSISSALVINIGTLSEHWIESMRKAIAIANEKGLPIVLDPVGAGASKLRTEISREFAATAKKLTLRGNYSEILNVMGQDIQTKGVDAGATPTEILDDLSKYSESKQVTILASGAIDYIVGNGKSCQLHNGSPMMSKVTGLGCTLSAITGAFLGVLEDSFEASASAAAVLGVCGEIAARESKGPGSLQLNLLDLLYTAKKEDLNNLEIQ